jgi:hypothetical protein
MRSNCLLNQGKIPAGGYEPPRLIAGVSPMTNRWWVAVEKDSFDRRLMSEVVQYSLGDRDRSRIVRRLAVTVILLFLILSAQVWQIASGLIAAIKKAPRLPNNIG